MFSPPIGMLLIIIFIIILIILNDDDEYHPNQSPNPCHPLPGIFLHLLSSIRRTGGRGALTASAHKPSRFSKSKSRTHTGQIESRLAQTPRRNCCWHAGDHGSTARSREALSDGIENRLRGGLRV